MIDRPLDLLCMGRAAVDLYSQQIGAELEEASTFAKYVGGCPANVAIGTARLGVKSGMLTAVGDEAMGRFVKNTLADEGVDVEGVLTKEDHLTALAILGIDPPDHFPLLFYRENCADMALTIEDLSLAMFQKTRALLVTGTHCSTDAAFDVTARAVELACQAEAEVILDIDYRPVLWGAVGHGGGEDRATGDSRVAERLRELLPHCRVVVGTEEEVSVAVDKPAGLEALAALRDLTGAVIVEKRGERGCACYPGDIEAPIEAEPFPVELLNVLGAGDAFLSGFLAGYLQGMPLEDCCRYGNANGALVVIRHGCAPAMPYQQELQAFMGQPDRVAMAEQQHDRLSRRPVAGKLHVLAFDHRMWFVPHLASGKVSAAEVSTCKGLLYRALEKVAAGAPDTSFGFVADSQYAGQTLHDGSRKPGIRAFQCIEEATSKKLQFLEGREAYDILTRWPRGIGVKVLCTVDPADDQGEMVEQLVRLARACRATDRELLIEFVCTEKEDRMSHVTDAVERCYRRGVAPSWWKLPPDSDHAAWERIGTLIGEYDPYCHGVLLLGDGIALEELSERLHHLYQSQPIVRGCAIGRSVWGDAVTRYFTGGITDEELVDLVAERFQALRTGALEAMVCTD